MSAMVKYEPGELPSLMSLAKELIKGGGFLPPHIKQEGELLAVIMAGKELGIPPMASIRGIRLIQGQVALDASLQLGLMIRAGIKIKWLEDGSNGRAALELTRPGNDPYVSRFTIEDAKQAGLVKPGGNWAKYEKAMLRARAVSAAGKAYCADILAGVYDPDELADLEYKVEPTIIEHAPEAEYKQEKQIIASAPTSTEPTNAERLSVLIEQRLPCATTIEDFAGLASELLEIHGKLRRSAPWLKFAEACANHEVSPREAVELATRDVNAEAAQ
jgi:hypothetical protein